MTRSAPMTLTLGDSPDRAPRHSVQRLVSASCVSQKCWDQISQECDKWIANWQIKCLEPKSNLRGTENNWCCCEQQEKHEALRDNGSRSVANECHCLCNTESAADVKRPDAEGQDEHPTRNVAESSQSKQW